MLYASQDLVNIQQDNQEGVTLKDASDPGFSCCTSTPLKLPSEPPMAHSNWSICQQCKSTNKVYMDQQRCREVLTKVMSLFVAAGGTARYRR